jgi:hypothetical protein
LLVLCCIRLVLNDFQTTQVLMGDNKPSVTAQQDFTDCTQSQHIDRLCCLCHCHAKKSNHKHIPGSENTADALTKALPGAAFKKFRNCMDIEHSMQLYTGFRAKLADYALRKG